MDILYKSTRSDSEPITASQAILNGLADDGGLYVPVRLPKIEKSFKQLSEMKYQDVALEILSLLLTDYTQEELRACIDAAYDSKFDDPQIVPIREADGTFYLELFHGPTIAFKDMALQILPHLMITAARKNHIEGEIVILTATSGDTGKAALAGFAGVKGTKIAVFYPKNGVSQMQERQMITQKGDNTKVIGITGNFDDAQTGVKKIFMDADLKKEMAQKGLRFSSANSINIGRLVPQIVYYVYAYTRLLGKGVIREGEKINITVPTGNFGNILAAYYAKNMGLPVDRLICASNSNKVLYDFFQTGTYDRNREFFLTSSPSMDILISSNLERLIYHICGDSAQQNAQFMKQLSFTGTYAVTDSMRAQLGDFYGGFASEEDTLEEIRRMFELEHYVIDPHTAVASHVYHMYREKTGDETKTILASTASPFKFGGTVMKALGKNSDLPMFEMADELSEISGVRVPEAVDGLRTAQIRHKTVCKTQDMEAQVRAFLGLD